MSAAFRGPHRFLIRNHFRSWALFPEEQMPGQKSEYMEKTEGWRKIVKKIPAVAWRVLDPVLFTALRATRRNALVFEKSGKVHAHVIFQRHGNALHVFSVWTNPSERGKGYAEQAVQSFISFAHSQRGITRVRIGGGNDPVVNRIYAKLSDNARELNIVSRGQNWLDLV